MIRNIKVLATFEDWPGPILRAEMCDPGETVIQVEIREVKRKARASK